MLSSRLIDINGRIPSMGGPADVEYLQNATLESLKHLTAELANQRFLLDYIQTLNAEDKAVARTESLTIAHRSRRTSSQVCSASYTLQFVLTGYILSYIDSSHRHWTTTTTHWHLTMATTMDQRPHDGKDTITILRSTAVVPTGISRTTPADP